MAEGDDQQHQSRDKAVDYLVDTDRLGFIWLDPDLCITHTLGQLATWAPIGEHICEATLLMSGFESSLRALPEDGSDVLTLPNITLRHDTDNTPTFTAEFSRSPAGYLATLISLSAQRTHEFELQRLVRDHRTRERELRELIQSQNIELERANKDLAAFAHLISHDLNAPIRGMRMAVQDLHPVAENSEATKKLTDYIDRMSRMLVGLLDYARIGHAPATVMEFELKDLIADIVSGFRIPPEVKLCIADDLPRLHTAPAPLDLVLRNLLDNALKYAVGNAQPRIEFNCEEQPKTWLFEIKDNGPGIPEEMHNHVFRPFAQLEKSETAKGTGLGLSTVQRTLETVGGTIELKNRNDSEGGACFVVHWPKDLARM